MATKSEIIEPDNAPGVIAYRVGQLEKAVTDGFKSHNEKLDSVINSFATKNDLLEITATLQDHENRLRGLGTDRDRTQGAIKVVYAALLLLVGLIGALWWIRP